MTQDVSPADSVSELSQPKGNLLQHPVKNVLSVLIILLPVPVSDESKRGGQTPVPHISRVNM